MKKLVFFLLSIFFLIPLVNADVTTYPRTEEDLGVNKKWTINESNKANVLNTPRVDSSLKIYDFANLMTEEEITTLFLEIENYISTTNMDMVIITTDLAYSDYEIEQYAADFYDYNDFGIDFEYYSGILLIRNVNQYNRYFNIYTFGEAQLYYPFERCEPILDNIYNALHAEQYLSGFQLFVQKATEYYQDGIPYDYRGYTIDDMGYLQKGYAIPYRAAFFFAMIATIIIMIILVKQNKMVKKATTAETYLDKSSMNFTRMENIFLRSHTSSYTRSSSGGSGGSFSGGGSRGGSSGGGHGGGGGRHG